MRTLNHSQPLSTTLNHSQPLSTTLKKYACNANNQSQVVRIQCIQTISKLMLAIALLITPLSTRSVAQDYTGNLISKNKVIFNRKSSNSYIQSLTTHTINFDGLLDQTFGNNPTNTPTTPLGTTFINSSIAGRTSPYDFCTCLAVQPDGKIVLGGYSIDQSGHSHFAAARYLPTGQLDATFGTNGTVALPFIVPGSTGDSCNAIALQPDGKIVMGGYTANQTVYNFAAARLTTTGILDTTFNPSGLNGAQPGTMYIATSISGANTPSDLCSAIALQPDGKIVMGGYTHNQAGNFYFAAARLTTSGQLDTNFGGTNNSPAGTMYIATSISGANTPYDLCYAIAIQSDDKIVMGGYTHNQAGNFYFAAARLTTTGILDTTFNPSGLNGAQPGTMYIATSISGRNTPFDRCSAIALQPDGKIVMGGYTKNQASYIYFAAARLTTTGIPDNTFGGTNGSPAGTMYIATSISGATIPNDRCSAIVLQPDGKIVMGGYTQNQASYIYFAAARLTTTGIPDNTFGGTNGSPAGTMYIATSILGAVGIYDQCTGIGLLPDGKIVMGGYITTNGYANSYFAIAQLINPMTLQTYQTSYAKVGAGLYV